MKLVALQHIIRTAQALAENRDVLILGFASLLASFPELGDAESPLAAAYDADLLPDPFDEPMPQLHANFRSSFGAC